MSLINSTVEDVSLKNGIGYDAVEGILDKQIKTEVDWKEIQELYLLGVDEISLKKGHQDFVSIITSKKKDEIQILAVLKDKKKDTVKEFFMSIPKRLRDSVRFVCTDMYDGFVNAAKEVFEGQVKVVIDRFHVAKLYRTDFDTIRKSEMRLLKEKLSKEEYKELKNSMWILRKKELSHTAEELNVMKRLFSHSPLLKSAYHLRNDLTAIFDTELRKSQARNRIHGWIRKVQKAGLCCFDNFIKTIRDRMDDILNYFIHRYTSGFVEGLNNKIKVLKRRCYGILNIKHLFQRIHLDLAGYGLFSLKSCG